MAKEAKRFEVIHTDPGVMETTKILRDRETGVCYLWHAEGYGGALTPLLNAVGTPVITGLPERR